MVRDEIEDWLVKPKGQGDGRGPEHSAAQPCKMT